MSLTILGCGGGGAADLVGPGPGLGSLVVSPTTATVPEGGTYQLTVTPMDEGGVPMAGLPVPAFSTNDPAKASVSASGIAPPGGDIPDTAPGNAVTRTFPTRGDYDYSCTHHDDMKGRVRVE